MALFLKTFLGLLKNDHFALAAWTSGIVSAGHRKDWSKGS
jgi:hypothetical protein